MAPSEPASRKLRRNSEREALDQKVRGLGLQDHVELLGGRDQAYVRALMQRATVLCAPCVIGVDGNRLREVVAELAGEDSEVPLDKDGADIMLLSTVTELRLFPSALGANAKILNKAGANWTMFPDAFEAANLGYVSGDTAALRTATKRIVDKAKEKGIKTVIVPETGHGYQVLRWLGANTMGERLPFDVLSIIEFIKIAQADGRIALKKQTNGASVTYLDPCRLSRKGGLVQEPRDILESMGFELRETEPYGRENYCCGGGWLTALDVTSGKRWQFDREGNARK